VIETVRKIRERWADVQIIAGNIATAEATEALIAAGADAVKAGIHPQYRTITVQCACGNIWKTRSTIPAIHVDICNNCHPFFTGKQKLVDTAGRVERFRLKYKGAEA